MASLSLIYPSLAGGSGFSGRGLWWWLCLAVAVVGVIGALIHNLRLQPTREELLRQSDRLSEHQKRWSLELHGALEVVARRLFEDIVTKTSDARLSVYYHQDKCFVQVCRLSGNPGLRVTGRGRYSDSQGIISDAWKKGVTSVVKLSSDRDEWVQAMNLSVSFFLSHWLLWVLTMLRSTSLKEKARVCCLRFLPIFWVL